MSDIISIAKLLGASILTVIGVLVTQYVLRRNKKDEVDAKETVDTQKLLTEFIGGNLKDITARMLTYDSRMLTMEGVIDDLKMALGLERTMHARLKNRLHALGARHTAVRYMLETFRMMNEAEDYERADKHLLRIDEELTELAAMINRMVAPEEGTGEEQTPETDPAEINATVNELLATTPATHVPDS